MDFFLLTYRYYDDEAILNVFFSYYCMKVIHGADFFMVILVPAKCQPPKLFEHHMGFIESPVLSITSSGEIGF